MLSGGCHGTVEPMTAPGERPRIASDLGAGSVVRPEKKCSSRYLSAAQSPSIHAHSSSRSGAHAADLSSASSDCAAQRSASRRGLPPACALRCDPPPAQRTRSAQTMRSSALNARAAAEQVRRLPRETQRASRSPHPGSRGLSRHTPAARVCKGSRVMASAHPSVRSLHYGLRLNATGCRNCAARAGRAKPKYTSAL